MNGYSEKVNDIEQSHELYQQVAILQENITKINDQSNVRAVINLSLINFYG